MPLQKRKGRNMKTRTIIYWVLKTFSPEQDSARKSGHLRGLSHRQVAEILEISHMTVWETVQNVTFEEQC